MMVWARFLGSSVGTLDWYLCWERAVVREGRTRGERVGRSFVAPGRFVSIFEVVRSEQRSITY